MKKERTDVRKEDRTKRKERKQADDIYMPYKLFTSRTHFQRARKQYDGRNSGGEMQAAVCLYSSGSNSQRHLQGC